MHVLLLKSTLLMMLLAAPLTTLAITVVECSDKDGTTSFRDRCPPGSAKTGEKRIVGVSEHKDPTLDEISKNHPVTLYSVPNCDACDLVRQVLQTRGIPFSEKSVAEDPANQAELKTAAGATTVPTVTIGTEVISGYSRAALDSGLTRAGFPEEPTTTAEAAKK